MSETSHITDLDLAQRKIERLSEELLKSTADVAALRDDSRRKMQELAREFRVPLTTILGFSDLLSASDKTHMTEWNQIAIAGHELMELINNLEGFSKETSALNQQKQPPAEPGARVVRSVLHIEDNETNFRLTESILEDRPNIEVLWAANGLEGVESAARHTPSLILLDLNLPDIHGSEVLEKLRAHQITATIPVIVLSADASPTRIERMLQSGARDYLVKPFDIRQFLFLVDEALRTTEKPAAAIATSQTPA